MRKRKWERAWALWPGWRRRGLCLGGKSSDAGGWTFPSGRSPSRGGGGGEGGRGPGGPWRGAIPLPIPCWSLLRREAGGRATRLAGLREGRSLLCDAITSLPPSRSFSKAQPPTPSKFPEGSRWAESSVWPSALRRACLEHSGHSETIVERMKWMPRNDPGYRQLILPPPFTLKVLYRTSHVFPSTVFPRW